MTDTVIDAGPDTIVTPTGVNPTSEVAPDGATPPQTPKDVTGDGNQPGSTGDTPEKTFSQAELDRIIHERIGRERQKYADYDALKERATKWAEHEEAQKSELEKALTAAQRAEEAKAKAIAEANERLIKAAFLAEAGKSGAAHPEDAYLLARLSEVSITDDGTVEGVAMQVKDMIETGRLPRSGKPIAPDLDAGAGGGSRPQDKPVKLTQEEIETARKMGVSLEDYQKFKET